MVKTRKLKNKLRNKSKKGGVRQWNNNRILRKRLKSELRQKWDYIKKLIDSKKIDDAIIKNADKDKYKDIAFEKRCHMIAKLMEKIIKTPKNNNNNVFSLENDLDVHLYKLLVEGARQYYEVEDRVFEDWAKGENGAFTPSVNKHILNNGNE
jgi:hypothetical protein